MKIISRNIAISAALAATLATGNLIGTALAGQPHMNAALRALQNANAELNAAAPDKGGHRDAAIGLIRRAINEVHAGIGFAR